MEKKAHAGRLCDEHWHAFDVKDVYEELQSGPEGLDEQEAEKRLGLYGPNRLPTREPPTIWVIIFRQLLNPLIFILFAAAIASIVIGEVADSTFIFIVIFLNSALGAYQEYQAEKSAAGLQGLLRINARVRRNGKERDIPAESVVPGDILVLESGYKVPADLRLIKADGLAADESFLTGESLASEKSVDILQEATLVSDRFNIAYAGSTITSGRGLGIVVGTAAETQVGIIARTVSESEGGKPPLVHRMERFVKHISILVLVISAVLAFLLYNRGNDIAVIFFFVVALAVSAIPEGLPVALTVTLSIATKRMSARNVIVRQLTAVESLGSCTIIASDKTGTLTVNQQTARIIALGDGTIFNLSGEGYNGDGDVTSSEENSRISEANHDQLRLMAESAILANEGTLVKEGDEWSHHGDAMDVAFLSMGYKLGLDPEDIRKRVQITGNIAYESERKFSALFYEKNGKGMVAAKGAVETILDFCSTMIIDCKQVDIDRNKIETLSQTLAEKGLRVLAVAGGEAVSLPGDQTLSGLIFQGLTGFIDPLRPEAIESVNRCKKAGIKVIMITGDHPATASAIAKQLGLAGPDEAPVTGQQLSETGTPDSPAFLKQVSSTHVFARVSPTQKLEIVNALILQEELVAVTGDGVNDAPALRRANIGVAMGSGTDVAKEVGSMIVIDDNFASIVAGVEEGRYAYDNVRKVIYLLISTGAAEVLMFITAILAGLPMPLLAVQLLWLNLVTNGIQDVALAFEGGEPGAMKRMPRRPDETIFNNQMIWQTVISGLVIGALSLGLWYWSLRIEMMDEADARNLVLLFMVLLQNVHVFNCRSESMSIFKIPFRRNIVLVFGVLAAQGIHILSLYLPFMQKTLGTAPVRLPEWAMLLALSMMVLLAMEIFKWVRGQE